MSAPKDAPSFLQPWPAAVPVSIRCEPDYYGAAHLIARSLGLPTAPISRSSWFHGCDMFPMPREVFSPQYNTPGQTHLVNNKVMEAWFRDRGLPLAIAAGCPIIYTPPSGRERVPGSVLLMPSHSLPEMKSDQEHAVEWLQTIATLRTQYPRIAACIHANDVAFLGPVMDQHGIEYFTGADLKTDCLPRMRAIFESFELMITDVQGSHIPYAAWCGCRVALVEPLHVRRWEDIKMHPHMVKYPQIEKNLHWNEALSIRDRLPFLMPGKLEDAVCPKDWAEELLGAHCKRTPQEMARLLGWQWDANDPAFASIAYEDVASWLGVVNADPEKEKLTRQHQTLKEEHQTQGKALRAAEKKLKQQQPYLDSISSRIGRSFHSIEKRVRRWLGKGDA